MVGEVVRDRGRRSEGGVDDASDALDAEFSAVLVRDLFEAT